MEKEFDLLVFIGRFQPFHVEHKRVVETALEKSKKVLILVGSAGCARTLRNPFTFDERADFIFESINENDQTRITVAPIYDKMYNDTAWIAQVQNIVNETALDAINDGGFRTNGLNDGRVGLIGMAKDHTSYYLKMFPQFESVDVPLKRVMHATAIREGFLSGRFQSHELHGSLLPIPVVKFMFNEFKLTPDYEALQKKLEHVKTYQKSWEAAPYPVKHVTVDAVVEQSAHVLLVKRRAEPGKGLWALPGGHLEMNETMEQGMLRELREETKIKVPEPVLRGNIVASRMFDDPHRSEIGRVITQGFHIKLPNAALPKVKGSDDAEKARWVPISDIREDMLYDDHYHILCYFLGI